MTVSVSPDPVEGGAQMTVSMSFANTSNRDRSFTTRFLWDYSLQREGCFIFGKTVNNPRLAAGASTSRTFDLRAPLGCGGGWTVYTLLYSDGQRVGMASDDFVVSDGGSRQRMASPQANNRQHWQANRPERVDRSDRSARRAGAARR